MHNTFECSYLLTNYRERYPFLSSFDPVTITRSVLVDLSKVLTAILHNSNDVLSFGKETLNVVRLELINLGEGTSGVDILAVTREVCAMALDVLDHIRTVHYWPLYNYSLLTAAYLGDYDDNVGIVVRFINYAGVEVYNGMEPNEVSEYLVASLRTIIGR